MFFIDSHCHLDYFKSDEISNLLKSCVDKKVYYLQNISVELNDIKKLYSVSEKYQNIFSAVGLHPCNVNKESHSSFNFDVLFDLYNTYKKHITCIGETGLDFFRPEQVEFKKEQIEVFDIHAELSSVTGKPLVVHCRDAEVEFTDVVKNILKQKNITAVMHCFVGSKKFLFDMLDCGFYISLSGIVTFKNALDLKNLVPHIPLDRILIETDSPYLAPVPMRGKRNEPAFVSYVGECVAEMLNLDISELANITSSNFSRLFGVDVVDKKPNW